MKIRHATLDDLNTLADIEAASYPAEEGASLESIRERLRHFARHFWVLEDQGEICAFVNGMVTDQPDLNDEMYANPQMHDDNGAWQMIFSVVTAPNHRKKGYAARLLEQMIEDCRAQQRKGIVLTCKENLLDFYGRFGFVNEGVSGSTHGNAAWYQMRRVF